jgi:hypothetical protein
MMLIIVKRIVISISMLFEEQYFFGEGDPILLNTI